MNDKSLLLDQDEPKTEWIRLVTTPSNKLLLHAVQRTAGDKTISMTVRRLIRQEAIRLNVDLSDGTN